MQPNQRVARELLTVPNNLLQVKCQTINRVDGEVKELATFLLSQLDPLKAAGFAACQFGVSKRLAVVRIYGIELVLINPEIVKSSKLVFMCEECRSLPEKRYLVKRPKIVKVRYINLNEEDRRQRGHELLAQILCHEIDHLNGITVNTIGELIK